MTALVFGMEYKFVHLCQALRDNLQVGRRVYALVHENYELISPNETKKSIQMEKALMIAH